MGEQLTESDVKKIKEEIEYRKIVVRKKELEAVKEARAQGDLSENFEYKAAKQDKNRNESLRENSGLCNSANGNAHCLVKGRGLWYSYFK